MGALDGFAIIEVKFISEKYISINFPLANGFSRPTITGTSCSKEFGML
jgi:hypothetical protein